MYVYSSNRGYRELKPCASFESYQIKNPDVFECGKMPDLEQLEEWESDGLCETPDGCIVEPDGECSHGQPSWLIIAGVI